MTGIAACDGDRGGQGEHLRHREVGADRAAVLGASQQLLRGRPHRFVPAVEQFGAPFVPVLGGGEGQVAFGRDVDDEARFIAMRGLSWH